MHNKTSALQAVTSHSLFRKSRWSNSIAQYSLLSFTFREKPMVPLGILKRFTIFEQLEQQAYVTYVEVTSSLKEWIFYHFKEKKVMQQETELGTYNLEALNTARGNLVLQNYGHSELNWSTEVEFDQSMIVWQIATEICCNLEDSTDVIQSKCEVSKLMSQYMLYLLVMNPSMLPSGMGQFVFEDTYAEAMRFYSMGDVDVHRELLQQYNTGVQVLGDKYRSTKSV